MGIRHVAGRADEPSFVFWFPRQLFCCNKEWRKGEPFKFFRPVNWVAFRGALTIYLSLLLFVAPAYASLSSEELDRLVPIVIAAESSGDPRAVGKNGERGIMQISKGTWKAFSSYPWDDAFDEEKNVQVGRAVLERINEVYGDRATKAKILYTYNTGRYVDKIPESARRHKNDVYRKIFIEKWQKDSLEKERKQ